MPQRSDDPDTGVSPKSPSPSARPGLARFSLTTRRAFWPPLLLMFVLAGLLAWQIGSLLTLAHWRYHTYEVIAQAQKTYHLAVDAEAGERGYLVSLNPRFREAYRAADTQVEPAFDDLTGLLSDRQERQIQVKEIRTDYRKWRELARREVLLREQGRRADAPAFLAEYDRADSKTRMDSLRRQFDALIQTEETRRNERASHIERQTTRGLWLGASCVVVIGGLLIATTRRNLHELSTRYEAILKAEEQALRRETLVNVVGRAIRESPLDRETILATAVAALGQGIDADRCYFGRYNQEQDFAHLGPDWHREGLPSIAGDYPMSRFSINRDPLYKSGQIQVVEDVRAFTPPEGAAEPGPLESLGLRALVRVPIQVGNEMTVLAVAMSEGPRQWTQNDLAVIQTVASQIQSALEAARLLLAERASAVREGVLHRIGEAVVHMNDPIDIRRIAAREIGEALQVDRCSFSTIDSLRGIVEIDDDWLAAGAPSFGGRYRLEEFGVDPSLLFPNGRALVVSDTAIGPPGDPWPEGTARMFGQLRIASLVTVPYYERGRLIAVFSAMMCDSHRTWTDDEVDLITEVAAQTRIAVEAVRLQRRERTIASQLQKALTPAPPNAMPGLALASYYRPALDEAEVGGDFIDVFALGAPNADCTALIVGDLSGKGLAAASQVATVRNMLRAFLLAGHSVGAAVSKLNDILEGHNLLHGFATLFAGIYNAATETLTYVSCGQEPGLILRSATGAVEELGPTGPVLGGFTGATFTERRITMQPGDALALFTDGLTEAAPSRRGPLLSIEGVAKILTEYHASHGSPPQESGSHMVSHLIESVDRYASGGVRDDIALLVAIVASPENSAAITVTGEGQGSR